MSKLATTEPGWRICRGFRPNINNN